MSMEIIIKQSEQVLVSMLEHIQKKPGDWMSLHINIAPLHKQMLHQEGLSNVVLAKIRKISMQIAQKLYDSGLSAFDGKIMVFEDSDVLALFVKQADSVKALLEELRSEFTKSGMLDLLVVEEMDEKLAQLVSLSEEKRRTATDYNIKRRAVEIGENLSAWVGPEPELTEAVQKKRHIRGTGCILIIEDDVVVRGLLATMLQGTHQIIQAKNAENGVISYIDQAPNVVFLDIHMPGIDGHDTGLGLSVVHGIVKQSEGSIEVYSEPGQGTCFKIYLPLIACCILREAPATEMTALPRSSETILLVEDEANVREFARHVLEGYGYAILVAGSAKEAMEISAQHKSPIHLLLTDVVMPETGGRALAEQLQPIRPQMKVLFMSGYTEDAVVRHGILHEEVNFLQKPYSPLALAQKVQEVLKEQVP